MAATTSQVRIIDGSEIGIFPEDLAAVIATGSDNGKILEMAGEALSKVQGIWRPRAVVRWFEVELAGTETVVLRSFDDDETGCLHLGFAGRFMADAGYGLVGVFTAGEELEIESVRASRERRVMDTYLYDCIGLLVLEKMRQQINRIVEDKALEMHWGVGPFLSPGSVHGWELDDQNNLCDLVALDGIGVTRGENGILSPFKTISCLIGIGPQYPTKTVGSTCEVCSKRNRCEMRFNK